jgi:NAD(P)-dependent dehydrogenase (short-subunit alcohol dehydrogenase family)
LDGKVFIVTGSTGIGAEFAHRVGAVGGKLVIATSDEHSGWDLAATTGAELWVGDLTSPAGAESVLALCLAKFARVDALFNAAGLSGRRFGDGPAHECTDEGWELTLSRNLAVTFYMCRAVTGRMLQQKLVAGGMRGAILNTASVLAAFPEPRHFATHAYAAAKGAVAAMSRSMAAFYAPHKIRVNAIAPAMVRTAAGERAQADAGLAEFLRKKQPLAEGMIDVADVVNAAVFLLGDGARSITGEVLTIDAGWSVTGV